jgi:glycerol-3-phosphate acyltransferase PlsX
MDQPLAPVAVDVMGGDNAPGAIVQGATNAARKGLSVVLVGDESIVRAELERCGAGAGLPITIRHASEVVEMDDAPGQAMRRKKDNSIRVCFELVKAGEACAMVSAGNSGAVMAGAIFVLGRLPAVERPAIITGVPALEGRPLILDMGANVESKPIHLVQFALMGEVYARRVLGVARPRVALLSNGEEESKGTDLTRAAAAALRRSDIDFRGYCEGRDLLTGDFDVIATDGFTGNVVLKTIEGTARAVAGMLDQAMRTRLIWRLGALLSLGAFRLVKKRTDWRETGGAPLLGVSGVGIIGHGRSDALAVENAVFRARDGARAHCTEEIAAAAAKAEGLLAACQDSISEAEKTTPENGRHAPTPPQHA